MGDSRGLLRGLPDACVDPVLTSPPFAPRRAEDSGNPGEERYVDPLPGLAAEVRRVLVPCSGRMRKLLADPDALRKGRPSARDVSRRFARDNGGAIPANLPTIPNTGSDSAYLRPCARVGVKPRPAHFPAGLPEVFVRFPTESGDPDDLAASALRFPDGAEDGTLAAVWLRSLDASARPVDLPVPVARS